MITYIVLILILIILIYIMESSKKKKIIEREKSGKLIHIQGKVVSKYALESKILRHGRGTSLHKVFLNMIIVENNNNSYHIQVDEKYYSNEYEVNNQFTIGEEVELNVIKYPDVNNLILKDGTIKRS